MPGLAAIGTKTATVIITLSVIIASIYNCIIMPLTPRKVQLGNATARTTPHLFITTVRKCVNVFVTEIVHTL